MALQKALAALLLLTIVSSVYSGACADNYLLDDYGFTPQSGTGAAVTGLNYCKTLKSATASCCDATTINGFQTKADAIVKTLTDAVAKRDANLVTLRTTTIPAQATNFKAFRTAVDAAAAALAKLSDTTSNSYKAVQVAQGYAKITDTLTGTLSESDYNDYRSARATCVITLVKTEAAAWCLACDPTFDSQGVGASSISVSDALTKTLLDACSPYLTGGTSQNNLLYGGLIKDNIAAMTTAMTNIAGGKDGSSDFNTAAEAFADAQSKAAADTEVVGTPTGCTTKACDFITKTLLNEDFAVQTSPLVLGGTQTTIPTEPAGSRVLRQLATGTWGPDADEAGVDVSFTGEDNSAALFKSIVGGLAVLFTVLLI